MAPVPFTLAGITLDRTAVPPIMEIRLSDSDYPPPPPGVREDLWNPLPSTLTIRVPVTLGTFTPPGGVYNDATFRAHRVDYVNGAYINDRPA